jgi:hypothetical protein
MKANLHLHSKYSDGTQWPKQIIQRALGVGLELIAITDHDTFAGVPDFLAHCRSMNIDGIAAIEIDCVAPEYDYDKEMLAYFPKGVFSQTQQLIDQERIKREQKMRHYLLHARAEFQREDLTIEKFIQYLESTRPGIPLNAIPFMKPQLYDFLLAEKVSLSEFANFEAFKQKFFTAKSPLDWEQDLDPRLKEKLSVDGVVRAILQDEGYAVIPHLTTRFGKNSAAIHNNESKYRQFLKYCRDLGVWGVEMYYYRDFESEPEIIDSFNRFIRELAEPLGYKFTYGSDCHGLGHESDTIEKFWGDFHGF